MLVELLDAVSKGRATTLATLAADLGTDLRGLRVAFDYCERLGYLERSLSGCPTESCAGCTLRCPSLVPVDGDVRENPAQPVWWRVTDRGARALVQSSGAAACRLR